MKKPSRRERVHGHRASKSTRIKHMQARWQKFTYITDFRVLLGMYPNLDFKDISAVMQEEALPCHQEQPLSKNGR